MENISIEIKKTEPSIHNEHSFQGWIPINKSEPSGAATLIIRGASYGRYLCIVERPYNSEESQLHSSNPEFSNKTVRSIEMCYWNVLAYRFQDSKNEWVHVPFWCPVPELPSHTFETISREDILKKIETGELEMINHKKERDDEIPGLWNLTKSHSSVYNVSFDDTVFISMKVINGLEDCIWAKKKSSFPLSPNHEVKVENLKLNQFVYHEELYWGRERMKIVGIRETEVELEGDYSGGTHNVCQKSWMPLKGLYLKEQKRK